MMKNKKAFTLAEVLITLTILGVVAAIVIPTMLRHNGEVAERTKLKKAIVDYEKVIENMRINEGYQTVEAMKEDMNVEGCPKSSTYFKIKTGSGCTFETNDGVWWDISDITTPIVSVSKDDDCRGSAALSAAEGNACYNKTFNLEVTQGTAAQGYAFIVNDPSGKAKNALAFAKIITEDTANDPSTKTFYPTPCVNPNAETTSCTNCKSCSIYSSSRVDEYNDDGILVASYTSGCDDYQKREGCSVYVDNVKQEGYFNCDDAVNGENCTGFVNYGAGINDIYSYNGCKDGANKIGCTSCYTVVGKKVACP